MYWGYIKKRGRARGCRKAKVPRRAKGGRENRNVGPAYIIKHEKLEEKVPHRGKSEHTNKR